MGRNAFYTQTGVARGGTRGLNRTESSLTDGDQGRIQDFHLGGGRKRLCAYTIELQTIANTPISTEKREVLY